MFRPNTALQHVECRKQRRCAVPLVVVGQVAPQPSFSQKNVEPNEALTEEAATLLATKLKTPLQIGRPTAISRSCACSASARGPGNRCASGYRPDSVDRRAWARKLRGSRIGRSTRLRAYVEDRLAMRWSPEQIVGRMELERADHIHQRPTKAHLRSQFGHWEGDLMHFRNQRDILLTLQERKSRLTLGRRLLGKDADGAAQAITEELAGLPASARRTIKAESSSRVRIEAGSLFAMGCSFGSGRQRHARLSSNQRIAPQPLFPANLAARTSPDETLANHRPMTEGVRARASLTAAGAGRPRPDQVSAGFSGLPQ